jgi:hypothetical protein
MKIDKETRLLLLYGGGGLLAYFGFIRPLLTKLGIIQTAQQQQTQQAINQALSSSTDNPFSPNYWKDMSKKFGKLKVWNASSNTSRAKQIFDAMGYFTDDEPAVYKVFKELPTKVHVSFFAEKFAAIYKQDLFSFLKQGKGQLAQAGLNDKELQTILDIVAQKPEYKK